MQALLAISLYPAQVSYRRIVGQALRQPWGCWFERKIRRALHGGCTPRAKLYSFSSSTSVSTVVRRVTDESAEHFAASLLVDYQQSKL